VDEQQALEQLTVRLIRADETAQFNELLIKEHYLHSAQLVGEHLRYVATYQEQWLALAAWSAGALHLKARDHFIGWNEAQRRARLPLVVNNARLCVLPDCHYPNLISRFMKLMLQRLSDDWQEQWQHPVAVGETFVDPQLYQGTAYKVSGWILLGETSGWKRSAVDFYEPHHRPKQIWLKELTPHACAKLRAAKLPPAWATVAAQAQPRCTTKVREISSLLERLRQTVPEFRRKHALAYPVAGVLALIALAMFSGVVCGYQDLADYAATLSQSQLRALGFRDNPHTGRTRCPKVGVFERVLQDVEGAQLEQALLLWQAQVLGPTPDPLVIFDGKEHRHAGVKTVSAVNGAGRWLGSVLVPPESNEIPAARQLLPKVDLVGKIALADAAHTQVETVQQILFEGGGDYVLSVKNNQKGLAETGATLLTEPRFSPSPHGAHPGMPAGTPLRTARDSGAGLPRDHARPSGLSGGVPDCQTAAAGAPQG
jgi:hypothetical protein